MITEWIIIAIVLPVVLCVIAAIFGQNKGQEGETRIYRILERLKGQKAIIPNCYLPMKDGGTTEVDLILIHESGIYVIESKNYSGWIFGSENQRYWTQSLPGRRRRAEKHQFYNPIWQNKTHVQNLKRLLQDNEIPYYSYVVFGNNCEFKDVTLTSGRHHVTYCRWLLKEISENARFYGRHLSDEQINAYYTVLLNFTNASDEQKARHVQEIYERRYPVVQPDGTWTCPWCGGVLVERIAQRGSRAENHFWGCSNYPKCKFIYDRKNIR